MAERPVLIVRHVPWEGPHRIADALTATGLLLDERCVLEGDLLPAPGDVAGAVFMGGPMNVDEIGRYPGLADEREWLAAAVAAELPVLGVCLGSQLLARALGSSVRPGPMPEIGWAPIEVFDADDPVIGGLAPSTTVLHWHGDAFDLPEGAELLASSKRTEVQAFRADNAWGTLFHAEADAALVDRWLAEPEMAAEAPADVAEESASFAGELVERSAPGFANFADLIQKA